MTGQPMTVVGAHVNRPRGHIAIGEPNARATAAFMDTGNGRLEWWAWDRGELDLAGAKALVAELALWVKRTEERLAAAPLDGQPELFEEP